jgi:hypothetical protein
MLDLSAVNQIFDPCFSGGGRKTEDESSPSSVFRLPSNLERICGCLHVARRGTV